MGRPLGQHFLKDPAAVSRILRACRLGPDDTVVEIGPGRGVLTRPLLDSGAFVIAVELDRVLAHELRKELGARPNFRLIESDFLELPHGAVPAIGLKFVGNLPYYVSSPILRRLVRWPGWTEAIVMVQKEVADRLASGPGSKAYGALTVETGLRATVDLVTLVGPESFSPPPKVDSAVIRLAPRAIELGATSEDDVLRAVHAAFQQRRKKIVNSIASALALPKAKAEAALAAAGIDPQARAETVPVESYVRLAQCL